MISFVNEFSTLVRDRVLDRRDISQLRQSHQARKLENPNGVDASLNANVLKQMDSYQGKGKIDMNYSLQRLQEKVSFQFSLTPDYAESDRIPGNTPEEMTQYISQKDTLADTETEGHRCAASSLINAYLLMGGKLQDLQKQFGLPLSDGAPTYAEIHRLQDAVYLQANTNTRSGLSLGTEYTYIFNSIISKETTGEISDMALKMGMHTHPLMGQKNSDPYNHEQAAKKFFTNNPNGVVILGVSMDKKTGELRPVDEVNKTNHAVCLYQSEGAFYLLDTGASNNGLKNARHELNPEDLERFVYKHRAKSFGVIL